MSVLFTQKSDFLPHTAWKLVLDYSCPADNVMASLADAWAVTESSICKSPLAMWLTVALEHRWSQVKAAADTRTAELRVTSTTVSSGAAWIALSRCLLDPSQKNATQSSWITRQGILRCMLPSDCDHRVTETSKDHASILQSTVVDRFGLALQVYAALFEQKESNPDTVAGWRSTARQVLSDTKVLNAVFRMTVESSVAACLLPIRDEVLQARPRIHSNVQSIVQPDHQASRYYADVLNEMRLVAQPQTGSSVVNQRSKPSTDRRYYVYVLLDGRPMRQTGHLSPTDIFYIGKGTGPRCYAHIIDAQDDPTKQSPKMQHIRQLWNRGWGPRIVRLFHELSDSEALTVEDLLVRSDVFQRLTNVENRTKTTACFQSIGQTQRTRWQAWLAAACSLFIRSLESRHFPVFERGGGPMAGGGARP